MNVRLVVFGVARVGAGMIAAVLMGVLFFAGPALAARVHVLSMTFGSEGSGAGQLKEPKARWSTKLNVHDMTRAKAPAALGRALGALAISGCGGRAAGVAARVLAGCHCDAARG
jgi:hypothetical protein